MHNRARIVALIVLLAILVGGGYYWWNQRAVTAATSAQLGGSGTIEAEGVLITAEVGGRIKKLAVDEGQEVTSGQTLAQLDTALLEAQQEQARAAVAVAEANLAQLQAGAREEDVLAAQAQVDQAQALRDGAAKALENAQKILGNPQELDAQVAQARAARDAARRALDQVRASSRPEDIAAADAAFAQAQANAQNVRDQLSLAKTQADMQIHQAGEALVQAQARYAQAKANWEYAQDTGNDPLTPKQTDPKTGEKKSVKLTDAGRANYYTQFVQAEAAMHQAEQAVEQAKAAAHTAHEAEINGIQAAEAQAQAAEATSAKVKHGATKETLASAQTALSNAQRMLDLMVSIRENPLQLHAAVDGAQAQLSSAEAQLAQAKAKLDLVKSGARVEQIQAGEAQLAQARAAQRQIEVQLAKATLTSPRDGVVLSRSLHEGEQANPGATLMSVGALDPVRLTIYIPETDIGRVRPGQKASVTVDSFPGKSFEGAVTFIAQEAQFTPRNVQTKDERATTVFAVRIELANADHALKPGMPADAVIVE
jgi:multidrug resistance efflux pump